MESSKENSVNGQNYILVKGDISGIQEFIFNVKSKGAAKSLKGRSFFMKVLTEITIQYLFDEFNVALAIRSDYRISTSGGNFFLKLPQINEPENVIQELQQLLSKSLRFSGVNLSLNYVELDERKYRECLEELNKKVRENRLKLFSNFSETDFNNLFSPTDRKSYTDIDNNEKWIAVTRKLRSSHFFSIDKMDKSDRFDLQINDDSNYDSIELIGYKCRFHNNNTEPQRVPLNNFLESIFPYNKSWNPKEFEELANIGNGGAVKLGILKIDVDNLGHALEDIGNIKEHKIFDNELNQFFNRKLGNLIKKLPFKDNIYTITAGGDDSFFVGNWKIILDLAREINFQFSNNIYFKSKKLSISAGYIIVTPKFPVIRFSQLAEEALHKAKYKYEKGNICLFNEVLSWEMLKNIQGFKNQLYKSVNKKSKGLLAKARQSAIQGIDEDRISLKENWKMAYYFRDVKNKKLVREIRQQIIRSSKIKGSSAKKQQLKRSLRLILPIAARLTELEKR